MQATKFREIVSKAAENSGMDEETLQNMSDFVFRECKEEMSRFSNLSIYFKGFFTWFYGRKRLVELLRRVNVYIELHVTGADLNRVFRRSFLGKMTLPELRELKGKVEDRLSQYEQYIQEKKAIRHANNLQTTGGGPHPTDGGDGHFQDSDGGDPGIQAIHGLPEVTP